MKKILTNIYWLFRRNKWQLDVTMWPRRIKHRVGVFIAYAPLLWRDHDWDHSYLVHMLHLKLTRIEYTLRTNGITDLDWHPEVHAGLIEAIERLEELKGYADPDMERSQFLSDRIGTSIGNYMLGWWD